ncbi:Orc1-type DNA replication protein [Natrialba magadii ATCC 43099]|uniref:ORC1-type DNA replication protein n=1 Tax=Natrialba magadii (strain ATCC 43099 / DSM 3394 / CCM 3739 / CIP 104546 / IAM 13178 / JCM 8861 / NBRC 102185 / NCIMB 2190 / MS3) TaxID=547559 RepID=D3SXD8_NATMM|nr:AAA family ATPase [Natrialba magadii]ADD03958.1 Orc1-type DNA replication protein [Natrialba magadii ATCC 43099]ELY33619.1 orc1/cdc6 family replication initiation protein [Natrialba magadii ATCC 43099]
MENPFKRSSVPTSSPRAESDQIFETKEPFSKDFCPDKVFGREDEIDRLSILLSDVVQEFGAPNILIEGQEGFGKRTVTTYVLDALQEECPTQITILDVDCKEHNSIYQILLHLSYEFGESFVKQGHPTSTLRKIVYKKLNEFGGTVLIILNNIQELGPDDQPVAEFQEACTDGDISNAEVGVIGLCNRIRLPYHLAESVKNHAQTSKVTFEPYRSPELRAILEYHAEIAFKDDVLAPGVVPKCAAISAQLTGDARTGLTLLKLAGEIAKESSDEQITEKHVDRANSKLDTTQFIESYVEDFSREEQLVGLIIALLDMRNECEIEFRHVYSHYYEYAEKVGLNQVSERRVRDFLWPFEEEGVVSVERHNAGRQGEKTGERGGIWHTYSLEVPAPEIVEAARSAFTPFQKLITYEEESNWENYDR